MMRLLDRYLLKNFLFSFALVFAVMMALMTVVQVATELDDFSELIQKGFTGSEIAAMIGRMSLYRLPVFFYHFSPYITLIAALFAVVRLHKANELIPMKAAGIGAHRIFLPFLVWSVGITGIAVVAQELIIPQLSMELKRIDEYRRGNVGGLKHNPRHDDGFDNRWSARVFNTQTNELRQATIDTPLGAGGRVKLLAESAVWEHDTLTNSRWWRLVNVVRFDYDERGEIIAWTGPGGRPMFNRHVGEMRVPWTPPGDGRSSPSQPLTDMLPGSLVGLSRNSLDPELISFAEIRQRYRLGMGDIKGLKMHMYRRFAHPLANVALLMIGLPLVVNRDRRGMAVGIMAAVAACILYESLSIVCQSIDFGGLWNPELAGLLPIMLFGAPAIYLFDTMEG